MRLGLGLGVSLLTLSTQLLATIKPIEVIGIPAISGIPRMEQTLTFADPDNAAVEGRRLLIRGPNAATETPGSDAGIAVTEGAFELSNATRSALRGKSLSYGTLVNGEWLQSAWTPDIEEFYSFTGVPNGTAPASAPVNMTFHSGEDQLQVLNEKLTTKASNGGTIRSNRGTPSHFVETRVDGTASLVNGEAYTQLYLCANADLSTFLRVDAQTNGCFVFANSVLIGAFQNSNMGMNFGKTGNPSVIRVQHKVEGATRYLILFFDGTEISRLNLSAQTGATKTAVDATAANTHVMLRCNRFATLDDILFGSAPIERLVISRIAEFSPSYVPGDKRARVTAFSFEPLTTPMLRVEADGQVLHDAAPVEYNRAPDGNIEAVCGYSGRAWEGKQTTFTMYDAAEPTVASNRNQLIRVDATPGEALHGMNEAFGVSLPAINLFKHFRPTCNFQQYDGRFVNRSVFPARLLVDSAQAARAPYLHENGVDTVHPTDHIDGSLIGIIDGSNTIAGPIDPRVNQVNFTLDVRWPSDAQNELYGDYVVEIPTSWSLEPKEEIGNQWLKISGPDTLVKPGFKVWRFRKNWTSPEGRVRPHVDTFSFINGMAAIPSREVQKTVFVGRINADGSDFHDRSKLLRPVARAYLTGLNGMMRYMNDAGCNQNYQNVNHAPADRDVKGKIITPQLMTQVDSMTWDIMPIEAYGEACHANGMSLWLTFPALLDAAARQALFNRAKASMPAGRKIGGTVSNERWHFAPAFQQTFDLAARQIAAGRSELWMQHAVECCELFDQFADEPDFIPIFEWQFGNYTAAEGIVTNYLNYPIPSGGTLGDRLSIGGEDQPGLIVGAIYVGDLMASFDENGEVRAQGFNGVNRRYVNIAGLAANLGDPQTAKNYLLSGLRTCLETFTKPANYRACNEIARANVAAGRPANSVIHGLYEWAAQNFIFDSGNPAAPVTKQQYTDRVLQLLRSPEYGAFFAEVTEYLDKCGMNSAAFASAQQIPALGEPLPYGFFSMADSVSAWRTQSPAKEYQAKVEELHP